MFIVPYENLQNMIFHLDSDWLEVVVNSVGKKMLPALLICEETFFIKLSNLDKLFHQLKAQFEESDDKPPMEKAYGELVKVVKSFSWLNL